MENIGIQAPHILLSFFLSVSVIKHLFLVTAFFFLSLAMWQSKLERLSLWGLYKLVQYLGVGPRAYLQSWAWQVGYSHKHIIYVRDKRSSLFYLPVSDEEEKVL